MLYDAVIIGAGYAGLAAADRLLTAGRRVVLLEARDRVGGRARTDRAPTGEWLDFGGQWLGPTQDEMYAVADRFGAQVWPMHVDGANVMHARGRRSTYRGLYPLGLPPWELATLGLAVARFDRLARRVPLLRPWEAPDATRLDQMTVGDWMRRALPTPTARELFEIVVHTVFAVEPDQISLLHALFYAHSGGGIDRLARSADGAQQDRVEGGMQPLAERWCAELVERGLDLRLSHPVTTVSQSGTGVTVSVGELNFLGRAIVCAVPPALALDIDWKPDLPASRRAWMELNPPGAAFKSFAIYERPFWRDLGLSGSAVSDEGPVEAIFDATPPTSKRGILMGFVEGDAARRWNTLTQEQRRAEALSCFERAFGAAAARPVAYTDHCWIDEPWSRGCYAGVALPGAWTMGGESVREPFGRVFWAGTETSAVWCGYFEGAVRSGHVAAARLRATDV